MWLSCDTVHNTKFGFIHRLTSRVQLCYKIEFLPNQQLESKIKPLNKRIFLIPHVLLVL